MLHLDEARSTQVNEVPYLKPTATTPNVLFSRKQCA